MYLGMTVNFTEYLGEMMDLCFSRRAEDVDHRYLDSGDTSSSRAILTCTIPLSEIVTDFFDQLKSRSSGFASFECVFQPALSLMVNITMQLRRLRLQEKQLG